MRRLGDERLEALSLAIVDRIGASGAARVVDRGRAVAVVLDKLSSAFQVDKALDAAVRQRIESLSRDVPEGGREWELLYQQYLEELSHRNR